MKGKDEKEGVKRQWIVIISFIILCSTILVIDAQVTQVIELTEKARNFFIESTKGNIIGQQTGNKFGQNLVVGTSFEDIQSQGGTLIFLQSAELITISSSDAADTLLGINATSVKLFGLDSNFIEITEIVNLSGTTNVNTTQEFIRINRMAVNEVGNYSAANAGTITGTSALSNTVQIEIPTGEGTSKTTHFTVPAGQNLIITSFRVTMDTGKTIDIVFKIRENANDIIAPMSPIKTIRDIKGVDTPVSGVSLGNLKFDEKTDIWAIAASSVGSAAVEVNYDFVQYAIGQ